MENLSEIKKFPSLLRKVETEPVECGSEIYSWTYLDEDRKLHEDTTNIYEQVQSYVRQTDYKKRIEKGEEINNGPGLYLDISELGDNPADIDKYIARVVENMRKDIAEPRQKITEDTSKSGEVAKEISEYNQQNQTKGETKQ